MAIFKVGELRFEVKKHLTEDGFLRLFLENSTVGVIEEISFNPLEDKKLAEIVEKVSIEEGVKREKLAIIKSYTTFDGNEDEVLYTYYLDMLKGNNLIRNVVEINESVYGLNLVDPVISVRTDTIRKMEEEDFLKIPKE